MKLVIGICLIAICTYTGKKFTEKYNKSKGYFEAFAAFIKCLDVNLSFKKNGVREISLSEKYDSEEFNDTIMSFSVGEEIKIPNYISENEKNFVRSFFSKLGYGNLYAEKEFLAFSNEKIIEYVANYKKKCADYGALGLKLGFAVGMAAFIVII